MSAHGLAHLFLFLFLSICSGEAQGSEDRHCPPSSCGKIQSITHPFRLRTDPKRCGERKHTLSCENNVTILYLYRGRYLVESISYVNKTIRLADPDVRHRDCSSRPRHSLGSSNFSLRDPYQLEQENPISKLTISLTKPLIFLSCESPVDLPDLYVDAKSCADKNYTYVLVNGSSSVADVPDSCRIELMTLVPSNAEIIGGNTSFSAIHAVLVEGIELEWGRVYPFGLFSNWDVFVHIIRTFNRISTYMYLMIPVAMALAARCILCSPFLLSYLIFKWRSRHLSMYNGVEEFLQSHNNLVPVRYSYSELKKMSRGFRDKLGEGGYGSVFKGKLRSGRMVAIKVLSSSKADGGKDFINEVATIGRIHHANVVRLIGFCIEGSKRCLVYEFMPEGSLDRHIFSGGGDNSLSSEMMLEIAIGVAHGIEYLHQGCEMQILHFDIKPHNILLDENFRPKVSDFGLARLCPAGRNTVSLTAARGTLGYIAPELFYKNIGGVSYKADVYSFGMLLMEMASRRKNVNSKTENSSKVHYPSWVSNRFSEGNEVDLGVTTEGEMRTVKKMMVVALWCIQFKPSDRPSMSEVVAMLKERTAGLQMPPTKFTFYPDEAASANLEEDSFTAWLSSINTTTRRPVVTL